MSLNLNYDAEQLELLGVEDGSILGESTFLAGDKLTKIPYIMNWDDSAAENNTGTGTLAILSFRAKTNAVGDTEVSVSINQKSTFNADLEEVAFSVLSSTITIDSTEIIDGTTTETITTTTTETGYTLPEGAAILVDTVSAQKGQDITVPIRIQNNPGIIALSINVIYDNTKLKLISAEDGKILGTSTFEASDQLSRIPFIMNWDDLSEDNNDGNGIVATLKFEVLGESGSAEIAISINKRSTFDVNLNEVSFSTINGAVEIETSLATSSTTTTVSFTETSTTATSDSKDILLGDVNLNGELTISDAVLLCRIITEDSRIKDEIELTDQHFYAADYNQDELITILDVSKLLACLNQETV